MRQLRRTRTWGVQVPVLRAVALFALAGLLPTTAAGQAPVAAGTRVRVSTPQGRLVGSYVEHRGDAIVLAREEEGRTRTVDVALADVSRVEVSQGRGGRGKGAKIGALVGVGAAVVIGALAGESCSGDEMLCFDHGTTGVMAGILTIPAGALIGLAIPPGEKWGPAPAGGLSVQPMATRGGGLGIRVAIAF